MAQHTRDDGFREIQLNGKQLVFLFMVATVFSVVIFLCGVFVGRGVRAERAPYVPEVTGASPVTTPDLVASQEPALVAGSDPTRAAPPPEVDELSYFNRLGGKQSSAAEDLKPAASSSASAARTAGEPPPAPAKEPAVKEPAIKEPAIKEPAVKEPVVKEPVVKEPVVKEPAVKETPAVASAKNPSTSAPPAPSAPATRAVEPPPAPASSKEPPVVASSTSPSATEPAGPGFALQVTALREKGDAETIARRLSSKGYSAYVLQPSKGAPSVYRVRVGKFKTRREAEAMATKLKKEEQFTPWITR